MSLPQVWTRRVFLDEFKRCETLQLNDPKRLAMLSKAGHASLSQKFYGSLCFSLHQLIVGGGITICVNRVGIHMAYFCQSINTYNNYPRSFLILVLSFIKLGKHQRCRIATANIWAYKAIKNYCPRSIVFP